MTAAIPDGTAYHRPSSVKTIHELLNEHGDSAKIVAGGQSLILLLRQDMLDPDVVIDITEADELAGVDKSSDTIRIGATVRYVELLESRLAARYEFLGEAIEVIADPQVRNMGTIGGAISHADPYLDIVPPLLCLDATIEISSVDGRRSIPLEEFPWGYLETNLESNEIVEAIEFEDWDVTGAYEKVSNVHGGWATVGVAATVSMSSGHLDSVQVALAGVDDTAVRSPTVESTLAGKQPTEEAVRDAANEVVSDINPLSDMTGSAEYKAKVARNLTRKSILSAIDKQEGYDD